METITDYYKDQCQQLHEGRWGHRGYKWLAHVIRYSQKLGAKSILDYGCGKGSLHKSLQFCNLWPEKDIKGYDPCFEEYSQDPIPADLVTCTDVMEHVEPEYIDNVFQHIRSLSNKGSFFLISTQKCEEYLPDGRMAHLTVQPSEWWDQRIRGLGLWSRIENISRGYKEAIFWCDV